MSNNWFGLEEKAGTDENDNTLKSGSRVIAGFETESSSLLKDWKKKSVKNPSWIGMTSVALSILVILAVGGLVYSSGGDLKHMTQALRGDISYGVVVGDTTTYPFVVRIGISIPPNNYRCTGNILSRTMVLTAAHCLVGAAANGVTVTAGQVTVGGNAGTTQTRTATALTLHPQHAGLLRDIAMIEVNPPFDLTTSVDMIGEGSGRPPVGTLVTSVGWGMNENDVYENVLKSATSNVFAGGTCQADAFEICTRGGTGSTCQADSGGPLLWERNGVFELVAFNERSPGFHCRQRVENVDIFESVPSYLVWIRGFLPTVSDVVSNAAACTQQCTNSGSAAISVGSDHMCAANYNNEGYRGGYNKVVNGQNVCVVGHGSHEQHVSNNFHCVCATKLVAFEPSVSQSCDTVCGARNTQAVSTGEYMANAAEKFYACGADNGGGLLGGFNLKRNGFSDKCYFASGGQERWLTNFKCVCV